MNGPGPTRPLVLGLGWCQDEANGLNRYVQALTTAMAAEGEQPERVIVVGPAANAPAWVDAVTAGHHRPLPWRLLRYASAARRASEGAMVVDAHFALFAAAALTAASVRRLPLVVHFHGPWAAESIAGGEAGGLRIRAKQVLERAVYRRASALIVLSGSFRRVLVENYGLDPWRVHVVAPGVELDRFSPGVRADARRRLDLPLEAFVAVACRRLVARTGIDVLLRAWAQLDGDDALLLITGDGPLRAALESQAAQLGIADRVRFLGQVPLDDLVTVLRAGDVSVVPSRSLEGFGLVVLESLACATPVVVTEVGGLAPIVRSLGHDLVVPPGDEVALSARLAGARSGEQPLPAPARCRALAESYSWSRAAQVHRRIYRLVAGEPSADEGAGPGRRRVVFLDHTAEPSGAELSLLRMVPVLQGFDAHVVLAGNGPLIGRLEAAAVSVEVLSMGERARGLHRSNVRPRRLPVAGAAATVVHVVRLARRLRRLRPDIVHTYSLKSSIYGGFAARLARVPVVWHLHDRVADDYLPTPAVRLVRVLARHLPDAVIANSRVTASCLTTGPTPVVVPAPVPSSPLGDRPHVRRAGSLRVGVVGRLCPWKGQDLFLRAFARAFPEEGATATVVGGALFGEVDYGCSLRDLVVTLGLEERVRFAGHVDDVDRELAQLDVLVHSSLIPEPFGMSVVEGMAAGLAVVAAGAGGPGEVITHGVDGLLYEMGDERELAARLGELAADSELRERIGLAGVRRARDYRPEVLAPAVEAVYERVLAGEPGFRRRARSRRATAAT